MNILLRNRFGLPPDPWKGHSVKTADAGRAAALVSAAADQQALVSIVGRSGSGKTKAVDQALAGVQAHVVEVQRLDREQLRMGDVTVALVRDLAGERENPRRSGEARAGQVRRLLGNAEKPVVLVIDDAHELHASTLRGLKRLRELRWSGRKELLGIVLVGETDSTAPIPSVDRRAGKVHLSGLSVAEARAALQLAWSEVLHADAIECVATSPPARNWFDMQRLLDQALLVAASRGESTVSAAAAVAAINRATSRPKAAPTPVEQSDATVDETLAELETAAS